MRDKDSEIDEFDQERCEEYSFEMRGVILKLNSLKDILDILS